MPATETDTQHTPSSSPSPSSPSSGVGCWGLTLTALGGMLLIGTFLWRTLPWAMGKYDQGDWKPLLGACFCVGMLVAPADTLGLVRRLLPGRK